MNRFGLWVAQGFFLGRIPFTPGTFGSLLGLVWVMALLATGSLWLYVIGSLAAMGVSVWLCGLAEKVLGQTDPGSVVLDEVVAMPLCFAGWMGWISMQQGGLPAPEFLITNGNWKWTTGIFLAFRLFDIAKPWPVRQSQSLPGGWGVTVDDILAAVYVNLLVMVVWGGRTWR
jgi:phosphatidylglycerophosphatase A